MIIALAAAFLLFAPTPLDPIAYDPPAPPPLAGPLAPNTLLRDAAPLAAGQIVGPEDVEIEADGSVLTGLVDGRIVRIMPDGQVETFARTGTESAPGRPLGIARAPDGRLIVVDARLGLLAVTPDGQVSTLATEVDGVPFGFADDVDVASDGRVYFSDASDKFGDGEYLYDLLEARPHGRLLMHDLATGETRVLLADLYFANGVALSQQEDFVLVNETYRYRITRYWLKGDKAGTSDTFVDNLPGFPDNISSNRRGTFWLALFTVRNSTIDRLHPYPFLKKALSRLPKALWPAPAPYGFVVALDEQGNILRSFQDPDGQNYREVTSAHEHDGALYFGTLSGDRVGRLELGPN
ncbi:MAG: SMP-30/gluconolactonase/LRE family protein [Pirellulales bacterium]|nr:SMP-30/gluconolactonase/LRE family protein [Pirellulales bacterium]